MAKRVLTLALALMVFVAALFLLTAFDSSDTGNAGSAGVHGSVRGAASGSIVNAADEAWVNDATNRAYIFRTDGQYASYTFTNRWTFNGDGTYRINTTSLISDGTAHPISLEADTSKLAINGTFNKRDAALLILDDTAYPISFEADTFKLTISGTVCAYTRTRPFTAGSGSSAEEFQ
jgi:hypothetical protein